ncbi:unnamed protein product, partial [Effrenium voratum]
RTDILARDARTAAPGDHPHLGVGGSEARVTARQVEDRRGGGGADPTTARGGAAQADHRDPQGHVGPTEGAATADPAVVQDAWQGRDWKQDARQGRDWTWAER